MKKIAFVLGVFLVLSAFALVAEEKAKSTKPAATEHNILGPADMKWTEGPPSLPPGAKMVVLDGDPNKKGPFTVRFQAPAGYKIPPHTHPSVERITVISGTIRLGMGDKFDEAAARPMGPGSFTAMPAGMTHFVSSPGETVVQIHSEGPFEIKYVNPADDPRRERK